MNLHDEVYRDEPPGNRELEQTMSYRISADSSSSSGSINNPIPSTVGSSTVTQGQSTQNPDDNNLNNNQNQNLNIDQNTNSNMKILLRVGERDLPRVVPRFIVQLSYEVGRGNGWRETVRKLEEMEKKEREERE